MKHITSPLISPSLGTSRAIDSFHFGTGNGPKVYLQASLHADEIPGMLAAWKLKQQLITLEQQGHIQGEIILVPVANPIGLNQHLMDIPLGRYELENGFNFNRGYLDTFEQVKQRIDGQLGEDLSKNRQLIRSAIKQAVNDWYVDTEFHSMQKALLSLCCDADYIIDMHCDFEAIQHTYSTHYSWDSVKPLAHYLGAQVNMLADETGGNPFDSSIDMVWKRLTDCYGEKIPKACQAITLELCGQNNVSHEKSDHDANAILNFMRSIHLITDKPPALPSHPESSIQAKLLAAVEPLKSQTSGVVVQCAELDSHIVAGQLIAEVIDPISDNVEQIRANQSGILFSFTMRKTATAGMLVAHIAGDDVIRSGYLLAP
ncbi:succinylglutamate desuccinylase/aspartoacylase family protein [Marinomonas balearica]|uniref:Succinylglutamate desuccinylase/Aspartoacylase catalytic domain-containing protein n=1 Tax=Marinomonas balearica TaxID=491947 RepID=A0A4R6M9J4_9GAMM|nr:succinylglutamate desuccinylase/aspartoacylase family protein [Marinomonas balearica]TDO98103.1 hypothetical protein DFP79_1736 [Marinomonas balearica]